MAATTDLSTGSRFTFNQAFFDVICFNSVSEPTTNWDRSEQ